MTLQEIKDIIGNNPSGTKFVFSASRCCDNHPNVKDEECILEIEDGEIYLCQDVWDGEDCTNKHGKKFSYLFNNEGTSGHVTSLSLK